jgi:phospholipid/cholesterol/gamma-HCH transport system substrate-binding protein
MKTRRYETIVGIFVVASLAALLVMVVIVAQQEGLFEEYVEYQAVFRNVSGLRVGSEVHLAGVTVGNVKRTVINPDGTIVVTFRVVKRYSDRVRADSRASIGFMGLLGDKILELTPGSPSQPPIPPEGVVASVEPLDITQMLAKAGPSLESLQKILDNLVTLTSGLGEPGSPFNQTVAELNEIVRKTNQGKGSLGLLINDPVLYREVTKTVAATGKLISNFDKTFFGTPVFKEQAQTSMAKLKGTMVSADEAAARLKEAATRLPDIAKKLEGFLDSLDKAGQGLPNLVTQAETTFSDINKATRGVKRSWLLRRYFPPPQERTIRLDADPGKD